MRATLLETNLKATATMAAGIKAAKMILNSSVRDSCALAVSWLGAEGIAVALKSIIKFAYKDDRKVFSKRQKAKTTTEKRPKKWPRSP